MTFARGSIVILLIAIASAGSARVSRAPLVEIDGCVMPAQACSAVRDVMTMRVGDRKIAFAVERLSLPTSTASSSKVLTELKLRGASIHGPTELTGLLVTGAHLRVRGVLRSGPFLLLQSVEPRAEK